MFHNAFRPALQHQQILGRLVQEGLQNAALQPRCQGQRELEAGPLFLHQTRGFKHAGQYAGQLPGPTAGQNAHQVVKSLHVQTGQFIAWVPGVRAGPGPGDPKADGLQIRC